MPKSKAPKRGTIDYVDMAESANWNVAADYARLKVMRHLHAIDDYILTARYGFATLAAEFEMPDPNVKVRARIQALHRLAQTLRMLIRNTRFACKTKDKPILDNKRQDIERVEKLIPKSYYTIHDDRSGTSQYKVNEDMFVQCVNILENISEELNEPLNRADLIFTSTEEFDPKKAFEETFERLTTTG